MNKYPNKEERKNATIAPNTLKPSNTNTKPKTSFTKEEKMFKNEREKNFNNPCNTPIPTAERKEKNNAAEVILIKTGILIFKKWDIWGEKMTRPIQITKDTPPTQRFPFLNKPPINSSFFWPAKEAENFVNTIVIVKDKTEKILNIDISDAKIP